MSILFISPAANASSPLNTNLSAEPEYFANQTYRSLLEFGIRHTGDNEDTTLIEREHRLVAEFMDEYGHVDSGKEDKGMHPNYNEGLQLFSKVIEAGARAADQLTLREEYNDARHNSSKKQLYANEDGQARFAFAIIHCNAHQSKNAKLD